MRGWKEWIGAAAVVAVVGTAVPVLAQGEKKDVAEGERLFNAQSCHMCHSIAGKGNKAHPLDAIGSKLSGEQIRMWIGDPKGMAAKAHVELKPPMPEFGSKLSKKQIDALVDYLDTLKKP